MEARQVATVEGKDPWMNQARKRRRTIRLERSRLRTAWAGLKNSTAC